MAASCGVAVPATLKEKRMNKKRFFVSSTNYYRLGLENVEELLLRSNKLQTLNEAVLQDLRRLKKLDMSNNQLRSVAQNAFLHLADLSELNLSGNNLLFLYPRWTVALQNLE